MQKILGSLLVGALFSLATVAGAATTEFDGQYSGTGTKRGGSAACPDTTPQFMTIKNGMVSLNYNPRRNPIEGPIADDGSVNAVMSMRAGGGTGGSTNVFKFRGKMTGTSFVGTVDSDDCQYAEKLEKK